MSPNDINRILVPQLALVMVFAMAFFAVNKFSSGIFAILFGMISYWLIILFFLFFVQRRGRELKYDLRGGFGKSRNLWISSVCYIPVVAVVLVAFLPAAGEISCRLLALTASIGAMNGFVEEVYWREAIYRNTSL